MAGYADGMTVNDVALFNACSSHRVASIVEALANGARTTVADAQGRTALHAMALGQGAGRDVSNNGALAIKCLSIVNKLVEAGANVEPIDDDGRSALELAASSRNVEALAVLIGAGARLRSALLEAARVSSSFETVKMLVEARANALDRNAAGRSPLDLARGAWGGADQAAVAYLESAEIKAGLVAGIKAASRASPQT